VLEELRVENLLLIERAELRLGPGLNVLTGETGAGKTVLAHALDLLLGGKPRAGIVRPGASEAYVEGVFVVPEDLRELLADRVPEGTDEVVLARRVWAEGRTRAYLGGRSATAADLQEIGGALLSFYGQHEHRKLTLASAQLAILDGFCGEAHIRRRAAFADAYGGERLLAAELEGLRERAGARDRELDLLEWELNEIDEAAPSEQEEANLLAEREKLRHAEALAAGVGGALGALDGGGDGYDAGPAQEAAGAGPALAAAARSLDAVSGVDADLDGVAARLNALALEADDLSAELRRYADNVDAPAGRLDAVEERLGLLDRLKRKHGGTIDAVLAYAEQCRARRNELAGAEEALEEGQARLDAARRDLGRCAGELRKTRRAASKKLAAAVVARLADLAMEGATFEARVEPRADGSFGPTGGDEVEFVIAPNPGVPAGPLREIASGGELSRVMLALMSVAADTSGAGTLVFDEIDAGIGGQTARAVGERLRDLAAGRQVIAITHLPQIASLAERHFRIAKDTDTETARTTVTALQRDEVVGELVRMLGAEDTDVGARRHVKELLKAA
jgi:DNA repair protein RecN (Recombination protein N)